MSRAPSPRQQLSGPDAIAAALDAGAPVRHLLVSRSAQSEAVAALVERARGAGARVQETSERDLWRMSAQSPPPDCLALVGPDPAPTLDAALAGDGAAWLLAETSYPGNAGFVIRTAEVSGADGVIVDAPFDAAARRAALRASMHADRFMPVCFAAATDAMEAARARGRRLLAVEDCGERAPWEADLCGPVLFVVGGALLVLRSPRVVWLHVPAALWGAAIELGGSNPAPIE